MWNGSDDGKEKEEPIFKSEKFVFYKPCLRSYLLSENYEKKYELIIQPSINILRNGQDLNIKRKTVSENDQ